MFIRIVKMKFESDKVGDFLANFEKHKSEIRNFKGCMHLELLRDKTDPARFFTYSYWADEKDLDAYRQSALFKSVWRYTKSLFKEKPEAWSVDQHTILN